MAKEDSRNEFALSLLQRAWQENHGNFLLVVGIIVSVLAWTIGYFQLIPDIRATSRPYSQSIFSTGHTLLVLVDNCASDEGHVMAMLYDAQGFNETATPLRIEELQIQLGQAEWRVHNLPYGNYVVLAFHDENGNDQIDVGERQGLSHNPDLPVEPDLETGRALTKVSTFAFDGPDKQISVHLR